MGPVPIKKEVATGILELHSVTYCFQEGNQVSFIHAAVSLLRLHCVSGALLGTRDKPVNKT